MKLNGKNLPDIIQKITIHAPIEQVWEHVSTAEGMEEWFMHCDFEAEEGYEFNIQSPFGPSPCKVLKVEESYKILIQWDTDGWMLTFLLKELGQNTEFTVIHGGWKQAEEMVPKAHQTQETIRNTMNQGWVNIVKKLKQVVEKK